MAEFIFAELIKFFSTHGLALFQDTDEKIEIKIKIMQAYYEKAKITKGLFREVKLAEWKN